MAPEHFRVVGVVSRSRDEFEGVPAFRTVEELPSADFVIASVPWAVMPDATRELVALGLRVLAETPPAPDLDGLRALWADVGDRGLVQVAEQYLLMPAHAARLAAVRDGAIGEPTSVQVSSTHLYHAVSMIRGLLGVRFEPATVTARGVHRSAGRPAHASTAGRRRRAAAEADHAGDARLRRGGHGPLRLHRQPVVEPAARAADRRARHRRASWSTTRSCGSPIRTTPVESH